MQEGDNINIDITSPGATLALGMMYWNSNNKGTVVTYFISFSITKTLVHKKDFLHIVLFFQV